MKTTLTICLLLVVAFAGPVRAQQRLPVDAPVLGAAPGPFIALSVADLDRQVTWYRDTLGFVVFSQGTVPGRNLRFALLRQGTALIEIVQWPGARSRELAAPTTSDPVEIHGFFKSGVVVADVVGLRNRLRSLGMTFDYDLRQHDGGYQSFGLRDPEGNLLQFFGK